MLPAGSEVRNCCYDHHVVIPADREVNRHPGIEINLFADTVYMPPVCVSVRPAAAYGVHAECSQ